MKNVNHKVGEKVVALSSNTNERCQPRTKGTVYTVLNAMFCSGCGAQLINVVAVPSDRSNIWCECGNRSDNKATWWTYSKHFASIDQLDEVIKEHEKVEDYEMCGTLLKILQEHKECSQ